MSYSIEYAYTNSNWKDQLTGYTIQNTAGQRPLAAQSSMTPSATRQMMANGPTPGSMAGSSDR